VTWQEEPNMDRAVKRAVVLAGALMLTQACASMESAPSTSTTSTQATGGSPAAQSYGIYGVDGYFKIEAGLDERHGKSFVGGYITNQWGLGARNVRLRVEALDASGGVTATYIGYVNDNVNPGTRVYFEVSVREKAPKYRVTVLSFDPLNGHG